MKFKIDNNEQRLDDLRDNNEGFIYTSVTCQKKKREKIGKKKYFQKEHLKYFQLKWQYLPLKSLKCYEAKLPLSGVLY